ncbi:related to PRO3-delta 1-pyrroline-5-carboxylate reductase [Rhynchosporium agropyri]|uniref:Pyrroline-5-carboxylate reductase n=1 Tax=Rhynchosporium agropyri TaxID=914238 RepID=A0A1E1KWP7_9HELO|nr:related to PRO3-delta 1-pyrroline-5-carboxylate reductase [Rhynchosporium agropyri]
MAVPRIQDAKLCFIGGGNMGSAIIGGLLAKGSTSKQNIIVSDPFEGTRKKVQDTHGVRVTTSNYEAAQDADLLVLAVKPQVAKGVCEDLAACWRKSGEQKLPLIVSICAGIPLDALTKWFTVSDGKAPKVVRVMPNTPALLGEGASGSFAGAGVSEDEKKLVTSLLEGFGKVSEWVNKEELIDVVTALSGSGPAYFFLLVEHMVASATALGMPRDQAERLAKQTCLGAGRMLVQSPESPGQLRVNVTSPKGTTEAALKSFQESNIEGIVDKAIKAAADRGEELGKAAFD